MSSQMTNEMEQMMMERFGKDTLIALATTYKNVPFVRNVNAFYENGSFYVLTYGLSNKMFQIKENPLVAISGKWFTAHGKAVNLGYFGKLKNKDIADKMRELFAEWIDNGHNDFKDINTIILEIQLLKGTLVSEGKRYTFDLTK